MHSFHAARGAAIDPAIIGSVVVAYEMALVEIAETCGYLPPRECRRAIGSRMLSKANSGERDPERLKIWGLTAIEEWNEIPLALSLAAAIRH